MLAIKRLSTPLAEKLRAGVLYVWNRPILLSVIFLVAVVFLSNVIIKQAFKQYTNCGYFIVTRMHMDPFFCDGYVVKGAFGETWFTIPGLGQVMNPPLERARQAAAWSVVVVFAITSLLLTAFINSFKSFIRLVTLNKEEWGRLMGSARTWLMIMLAFGSLFYFIVIR